jgi:hypothetical protein
MATTLNLSGVGAITGGVLNLNGTNTGMASITLLPGWRPRVAKRRRGVLGGKRHEDVVESIPLRVHGASELECVTALEVLAAAMDQARNWKDGAAVDAVIFNYAIDGTTLASALQTAVLGTPMDAADILSLPVEFNRHLQVFEVNPVTLPVERRGLWLGDEESEVTSGEAENPVVNTAAFTGALTTPGPVDVEIEFRSGNGDSVETGTAFAFIADDADKLYVSTTLTGATLGTSTITNNHADADASANETLHIVPNDTVAVEISPTLNHTFPATPGNHAYMFFLVLRNNSASIHWDITQMRYHRAGKGFTQFRTFSNIRVEAGANNPQIASIGPLWFNHSIDMVASGGTAVAFFAVPSAGSGAGHELEVDTLAAVELGAGVTSLTLRDVNFKNTNNSVVIEHALLSRLKPVVGTGGISGDEHSINYDGLPLIYNGTAEIAALVLGIQDDNWLLGFDFAGSYVPVDIRLKATRRPAYLVPR